jgi:hypothetical protein
MNPAGNNIDSSPRFQDIRVEHEPGTQRLPVSPNGASFSARDILSIPAPVLEVVGIRDHILFGSDITFPTSNPLYSMVFVSRKWIHKIPRAAKQTVLTMFHLPVTDPWCFLREGVLSCMHVRIRQSERDK